MFLWRAPALRRAAGAAVLASRRQPQQLLRSVHATRSLLQNGTAGNDEESTLESEDTSRSRRPSWRNWAQLEGDELSKYDDYEYTESGEEGSVDFLDTEESSVEVDRLEQAKARQQERDNARAIRKLYLKNKLYDEDDKIIDAKSGMEMDAQGLALMQRLESERVKPSWADKIGKTDSLGRTFAVGRRKTASARVWISPSPNREMKVFINRLPLGEYFRDIEERDAVIAPYEVTGTLGDYDTWVFVQGGGPSGQSQAIRLGVARALRQIDPELRLPLKKYGYLTRDSRVVERKKPGLKKARKAPTWVKR